MYRLGLRILVWGSVVAILLAAAQGAWWYAQGDRLLSVQTGSMSPVFRPGDAVLTTRVTPSQLGVGQVISFRSSEDPSVVLSHRIIHINQATHLVTTQGDNLPTADPAVSPSQIIGTVWAVAPGLGRIIQLLRTPLGMVAGIYFPAGLVVVAEMAALLRASRPRVYRLYAP